MNKDWTLFGSRMMKKLEIKDFNSFTKKYFDVSGNTTTQKDSRAQSSALKQISNRPLTIEEQSSALSASV